MSQHPFHQNNNQAHRHAVALDSLSKDLRRMLSVQLKEFIHHIEDSQPDNEFAHNPRVLGYLERCYTDAA